MDSEFQRWREEQRHRESMARGTSTPALQTPTIQSSVAVPALQALLVGLAVGILSGGLSWLFGATFVLGGKLALAGLAVGTSGTLIVFVFQERAIHSTPALIARQKLALSEPAPMPEPEDTWRVIRPFGGRPAPALAASYHQDVQSIEPAARPEIRELHDFICACWDGGQGNLSRAACRDRGYTRSQWESWIGGKRSKRGTESGRGLLDRAGVIEQASTGWQWREGVALSDVFAVSDELASYADARAKMVSHRRDRTGRTRTTVPGVPD